MNTTDLEKCTKNTMFQELPFCEVKVDLFQSDIEEQNISHNDPLELCNELEMKPYVDIADGSGRAENVQNGVSRKRQGLIFPQMKYEVVENPDGKIIEGLVTSFIEPTEILPHTLKEMEDVPLSGKHLNDVEGHSAVETPLVKCEVKLVPDNVDTEESELFFTGETAVISTSSLNKEQEEKSVRDMLIFSSFKKVPPYSCSLQDETGEVPAFVYIRDEEEKTHPSSIQDYCSRDCRDSSSGCSDYQLHIKSNHCDSGEKDKSTDYLRNHVKVHCEENTYKCKISNSTCLQKHQLGQLVLKPHKCDNCNVSFRDYSNLQRHRLIHTGEKPYKCDICMARFRLSHHLQNHKLIHTGEKPHKCDICGSGFRRFDILRKHQVVHSREKTHICDVCGSSFGRYDILRKHLLIHSGEKPHVCDICGKRFRESGNMQKHHLIHTGEKPYKCNICNASFRESGILQKHRRIHTGEKPYKM